MKNNHTFLGVSSAVVGSVWWHLSDDRHSFPPSCVTTVYTPWWCQAGHAEVKVSISHEPGQLSHPCVHHCSNTARGRGCVVVLQSEDSAVRLITLFRMWCSYWTVWPKVTLTSYLFSWVVRADCGTVRAVVCTYVCDSSQVWVYGSVWVCSEKLAQSAKSFPG